MSDGLYNTPLVYEFSMGDGLYDNSSPMGHGSYNTISPMGHGLYNAITLAQLGIFAERSNHMDILVLLLHRRGSYM